MIHIGAKTLAAQGSSWLAHTAWVEPLAAIVAAIAAVGTLVAAVIIAFQASKVAVGQKAIAGLSEVNRISEKLKHPRLLVARRSIAEGYLAGEIKDVDAFQSGAFEMLDFIEEISVYESNRYIDIDTLGTLYANPFICWWYASKELVQPYRDKMHDPLMWLGTQKMIQKLHLACKPAAPDWAVKPSDDMMRNYFEGELESIEADERWSVVIPAPTPSHRPGPLGSPPSPEPTGEGSTG